MKKLPFLVVFLFAAGFCFSGSAEAQSGCCSYHSGVCGCRCCDGTSLSAKCAPNYPSCDDNGKVKSATQSPSVNSYNTAAGSSLVSTAPEVQKSWWDKIVDSVKGVFDYIGNLFK